VLLRAASLAKNATLVLDCAKFSNAPPRSDDKGGILAVTAECAAQRLPPRLPEEFEALLACKSFTSKKADLPTVNALYRAAFDARLAKVDTLVFGELAWGDDEVGALCRVLQSGATPCLEELYLHTNRIGDAGMAALAACLRYPAATPNLKYLNLSDNQASEAALRQVREARPAVEVVALGILDGGGGVGAGDTSDRPIEL